MSIKLTTLVAGAALVTGLSTAHAEEPYVLSAEQMDTVTAAGFMRTFEFNSEFRIVGFVFANVIDEEREIVTDTGAILRSTISLTSSAFRGFASSLQRSGSFETIATFN